MAVMTLKETQTDTVKARLADILMHVSWGDISREYFGKSGSWLYHKLNGVDGNKKPTDFTIEERYQLKGALIDFYTNEHWGDEHSLPHFCAPVREILRPHEGNIFTTCSSKSRARANTIKQQGKSFTT